MITLNHKVSHEVMFQRKLGELLGVIGEIGGSPYIGVQIDMVMIPKCYEDMAKVSV